MILWFAQLLGATAAPIATTPNSSPIITPPPSSLLPPGQPPGPEYGLATADHIRFNDATGEIRARGHVTFQVGEYILTGNLLTGNVRSQVVLTGNSQLVYRGLTATGDRIVFYPKRHTYEIDHPSITLSPEFLQNRLISPLFISGGEVSGKSTQNISATNTNLTTCPAPKPHYEFHAGSIEVIPGKRAILKRVGFDLFGHPILTLPVLVLPLNERFQRHRSTYTPSIGRSADEGFYVKTALNYLLSSKAPGIFRLDAMEKKGIGLGINQNWDLAKMVGGLMLYDIPTSGSSNNLSASLNNQQSLGAGYAMNIGADYQRNSYLSLPDSTVFNTRFGLTRHTGNSQLSLNLSRLANDSSGFSTHSYAATLSESAQFSSHTSLTSNFNLTRYSTGGQGISSLVQQLDSRLELDNHENNYTLTLIANRTTPVGRQSSESFFSGVQRLPEVNLNNYRFDGGFLSKLPLTLGLGFGRYIEPQFNQNVATERAAFSMNVSDLTNQLTRSTHLTTSFGFRQFFYADGFAQYVLQNTTDLTQDWGKGSGVNINYTYQRAEGGTPFNFDVQGGYNAINADLGVLSDPHFQATARVGYDFNQTGFGAIAWQTFSANLLFKPSRYFQWQNLITYDPNSNRFIAVTSTIHARGPDKLALDLVTRYDAQLHTFGNINGYINLPFAKVWRLVALFQYNGYIGRFMSQDFQLTRNYGCLTMGITYINNPFGFRNDRSLYFTLQINAFPVSNQFGIGQFGQAIDTSVGGIY